MGRPIVDSAAAPCPPPASSGAELPEHGPAPADVLLLAPDLAQATSMARMLTSAGLRVDRGKDSDDAAFAVASLPPARVVLVAVDDMLERARIRRALAVDPSWGALPVVEVGLGALDADLLTRCIDAHRAT